MRSLHCLRYLDAVKHVEGDVIELGVAWGVVSITLLLWMHEQARGKTLFACDTFVGLPETESEELHLGRFNFGNAFEQALRPLPIRNARIVRGNIGDTLPELSDRRFCFAWLDLDLYSATSFAAKWVSDRITPGGVIGFHDYQFPSCPGVTRVVDEELDRERFELLEVVHTCAFFRRRS